MVRDLKEKVFPAKEVHSLAANNGRETGEGDLMTDDQLRDRYNPLKSSLNVHSEKELECAVEFAMQNSPEIVAWVRGEIQMENEVGMSLLLKSLRLKLPDITLVELAHAAQSISLKLFPLTERDLRELDEFEKRSIKNAAAIKAQIARSPETQSEELWRDQRRSALAA